MPESLQSWLFSPSVNRLVLDFLAGRAEKARDMRTAVAGGLSRPQRGIILWFVSNLVFGIRDIPKPPLVIRNTVVDTEIDI